MCLRCLAEAFFRESTDGSLCTGRAGSIFQTEGVDDEALGGNDYLPLDSRVLSGSQKIRPQAYEERGEGVWFRSSEYRRDGSARGGCIP